MHTSLIVGCTTFLSLLDGINAQACAAGSAQEINGNWYCSKVSGITYTNFPGTGTYNKVTDMNAATGECKSEKYSYSGSLSPLNEELSVHIRGPIRLKQFAFYSPSVKSNTKHDTTHVHHGRRHEGWHGKRHNHIRWRREARDHAVAERSVGQVVSATIDGQLVSWVNEYAGPGVATNLPAPVGAKVDDSNDSASNSIPMTPAMRVAQELATISTAHPSTTVDSNTKASPTTTMNEGWAREAYYDAANGLSQGLTFLNHFGGTDAIPGTAAGGPPFGASLSYASSDGKSGAKSPQILSDTLIEDNIEVIIMSNQSCDDGNCGYARPGGVNYHGFDGPEKVFLFEFSMPSTGNMGFNEDMPAIWVLNANIPRTSQYGTNEDCSCWTSGCGEFDLFEVLDSGNHRCKSTLHMAPAGGSSDWFQRPTDDSVTAALIVDGKKGVAAIRVLDHGQSFEEMLSNNVVHDWIAEDSSMFKMGH